MTTVDKISLYVINCANVEVRAPAANDNISYLNIEKKYVNELIT